MEKEKRYQCEDCKKKIWETQRLKFPSISDPSRFLYKCPYCRGKLEEIKE